MTMPSPCAQRRPTRPDPARHPCGGRGRRRHGQAPGRRRRRPASQGAGRGRAALPPLFTLLAILVPVAGAGPPGSSAACRRPPRSGPSRSDLILDPFFDRGGVDKGLFWHVATSLSRRGAGLFAVGGRRHRARRAGRLQPLGAPRRWTRSSRCCAPCRRWPGCRSAWPPSTRRSRRPCS